MKKKYTEEVNKIGDKFRKTFVLCIEEFSKTKTFAEIALGIKQKILYSTVRAWCYGYHAPSLSSSEKFLEGIPNLKIKVTNKLTKEELFFDSFRDVILLVRKEYKSRYETFAEAYHTLDLLNKNISSYETFKGTIKVNAYLRNNGFNTMATLLTSLNYEGEFVVVD